MSAGESAAIGLIKDTDAVKTNPVLSAPAIPEVEILRALARLEIEDADPALDMPIPLTPLH